MPSAVVCSNHTSRGPLVGAPYGCNIIILLPKILRHVLTCGNGPGGPPMRGCGPSGPITPGLRGLFIGGRFWTAEGEGRYGRSPGLMKGPPIPGGLLISPGGVTMSPAGPVSFSAHKLLGEAPNQCHTPGSVVVKVEATTMKEVC